MNQWLWLTACPIESPVDSISLYRAEAKMMLVN